VFRKLLILSILFCLLTPNILFAETSKRSTPFPTIDELAGTNLTYKIAFLWMNHVANGVFHLEKGTQPGTYRALLSARTRGVYAWLTNYRIQSYETLMQKQTLGKLITLTHDSSIEKGKGETKKVRTKHYNFDPDKGTITVSKIADGELWWEKDLPFTGNMPVDILTAYCNFVTGVYGQMLPGVTYVVPAFGGKSVGEIKMEVLTEAERTAVGLFPEEGILCRFTVDKEIFDTGDGAIYVWYDNKSRPALGIIKDIIGMGDIRGVMR